MRVFHWAAGRKLLGGAAVVLLAATSGVAPVAPMVLASSPGDVSAVPLSGTGGPTTGPSDVYNGGDQLEFPAGDSEEATDAYNGTIDRSLSSNDHVAQGVSVSAGKKAKSNPTFVSGFAGLNHYQQRYSRQGNQFSVEPPDQGLCVGNGRVLEVVNDVLNVYDTAGQSVLPDNTATNIVSGFPRNVNHTVDLNSFYGYVPAIDRATGVRGEFVTDPSCLFDAQTQRWFVVVLTLDSQVPGPCQGVFSCVNHLDLAVSQTSDPTGQWNIYKINVTNDGTDTGGVNPGPYLGDYPHMGADANAIYLTTNSYPWHTNGFSGAQIYALSKAQLAAGASNVTMAHFDTSGLVNEPSEAGSSQPGFTVWPAQSPGASQFSLSSGGTEYFLSSNAADEAQHPVSGTAGTRTSNQLVVWTLTNTSSINSATPTLNLTNKVLSVGQYGLPPQQRQPGSGLAPGTNAPQGLCLNDETTLLFNGQSGCWKLLVGSAAHAAGAEVISTPDANDTRMQQVMYANGKLWGALDTAVTITHNQAGIAWYIVNPSAGSLAKQGYLAADGWDFAYPAIGVTASGRGVMAFTATGDSGTEYPSAAYAPIDASVGVGSWNIVNGGAGAALDDGFTGYKQQRFPNAIRPRWGDYGAAAVDGNSVWVASEYIQSNCTYTDWGGQFFAGGTGDNLLGTCGGASHGPGTRTALANWSTRVSQFAP